MESKVRQSFDTGRLLFRRFWMAADIVAERPAWATGAKEALASLENQK